MTNTPRLIVLPGGPGSGKTAALIARFESLTPAERARAAFLTVSRPAARELERRLRESGGDPAPPVWTLPQLPGEVLRAAGASPLRTLSETDRQRLLGWLLARDSEKDDAPERLKGWASSRRAVASDLSAAVGLLQRCRVSPEEFRAFAENAGNADLLGALARLHGAYGEAISALGAVDFDGLNEQALQALEARHRPALPDILLVDEAQEMDALQVRLVAALAGAAGRVVAAVDAVQRTQMYRGATPDATAALSAAMGEPADAIPCDGGCVTGVVRAMAEGFGYSALSACAPTLAHLVARTPEDEARLVAEAIRGATGRRAVLTRSNRAALAMQEALRKEGIAVAAAWLGSSHAQRFLRDALTLLRDARHDDEDLCAARLRSALRLLASSDAPDDEVARARKACAADPSGPLPKRVHGWVDDAKAMGSLAQQVHWLCACSRWLPRLPEADRDAGARAYSSAMVSLMGLEETWHAAAPDKGPLPPTEALSDLRGILLAAIYPDAEPSPAPEDEDAAADLQRTDLVDVLPIHQAAGRHWDHVILCELQDGGFPQYPTPSPFIPEAAASEARAWLEGREGRPVAMGRFERRAEVTVEEERRLFLTALSRAAKTVTLACHVQEDGHPVAPSWFLQKLLPDGMTLSPDAPEGWRCLLKDTLPVRDGGLDGCETCRVTRCGGRKDGAGRALPVFEPAAETVPVPAAGSGAPALGERWSLSATALNSFYACPRKYFLASALRLSDVDADSMAAGTALHAIMERFNKAAPPRTLDTLRQAMAEVFQDERPGRRFSSEAAWRLAQRKMRRALELFWERAEDRDGNALWVEESITFSLEDDAGAPHGFGGKVDLAVPREGGLAIVDYKSSRPSKASDLRRKLPVVNEAGDVEVPEDGDVQLALYAAGALANGHTPCSVAHEYITVSRPGEGARATIPIVPRSEAPPDGKGGLIREDLEAFATFFGGTAREIKGTAAFAADPVTGECEFYNALCPFATVCDHDRSEP